MATRVIIRKLFILNRNVMKYISLFFIVSILLGASPLFSQITHTNPYPVYADTALASVYITIDPDSLAQLLHPDNIWSDHEYPANFKYVSSVLNDSVGQIGFRLRGNTSRESAKKSFKVSFNTFVSGRKFHGYEKLNLNGEHNDPSIIRAKLSWDLFRNSGVVGSHASYARLYVNGVYFGLYINVEHVDENFVESRFGDDSGNLYKCLWPADLQYISDNPDDYKFMVGDRRTYDLKTNTELDDYSDLAHFISVLNQSTTSQFEIAIQQVFNVPAYLQLLAVDVATSSWDDYWFLKNNYYLYHNLQNDKFHFIPYDYDNSFGIWWDGIYPGIDWGYRDIYNWGRPDEPRPLANRLLAVQKFRDWYSYYLNRLVQQQFVPTVLNPHIDEIHDRISDAAEADSFRTLDYGYTSADFHNSYTLALGGHVTYGLKPYIETRRNSALGQLQVNDIYPVITEQYHRWIGTQLYFYARIDDESPVAAQIHYSLNNTAMDTVFLFDDGNHGDAAAADGLYAGVLGNLPQNGVIRYYLSATDVSNKTSLEPAAAPIGMNMIRFGGAALKLYINELMASNTATISDEAGEFEDWIELYNGDTTAIELGSLYLSDTFDNPGKWQLPDTSIEPGGFLLIWADEDQEQGPLHTNFKLSKDGEDLSIAVTDEFGFVFVDSLHFPPQATDISYGRIGDGGPEWDYYGIATPGFGNAYIQSVEDDFFRPQQLQLRQNYPNPFNPSTRIEFTLPTAGKVDLRVFDTTGRLVRILTRDNFTAGSHALSWDGRDGQGRQVTSGVYFYRLQSGTETETKRLIYLK
jgi:spore coat protein H